MLLGTCSTTQFECASCFIFSLPDAILQISSANGLEFSARVSTVLALLQLRRLPGSHEARAVTWGCFHSTPSTRLAGCFMTSSINPPSLPELALGGAASRLHKLLVRKRVGQVHLQLPLPALARLGFDGYSRRLLYPQGYKVSCKISDSRKRYR